MKTRNVLIALAAVAMFAVPATAQEAGCCLDTGDCVAGLPVSECDLIGDVVGFARRSRQQAVPLSRRQACAQVRPFAEQLCGFAAHNEVGAERR